MEEVSALWVLLHKDQRGINGHGCGCSGGSCISSQLSSVEQLMGRTNH